MSLFLRVIAIFVLFGSFISLALVGFSSALIGFIGAIMLLATANILESLRQISMQGKEQNNLLRELIRFDKGTNNEDEKEDAEESKNKNEDDVWLVH